MLALPDEERTTVLPLIENLSLPIRLNFAFGTRDEGLLFDRVN